MKGSQRWQHETCEQDRATRTLSHATQASSHKDTHEGTTVAPAGGSFNCTTVFGAQEMVNCSKRTLVRRCFPEHASPSPISMAVNVLLTISHSCHTLQGSSNNQLHFKLPHTTKMMLPTVFMHSSQASWKLPNRQILVLE